MYRRFIAPALKLALDQIGATTWHEGAKRRAARRAFSNMGGYSYPPNGARECERRRHQIAAGSLRAENGLVSCI